MKRTILMLIFVLGLVLLVGSAVAAECSSVITLLNQDPYPAIPGEYVKLVFQIDGLSNPNCGNFYFGLSNEYPIQFDPGASTSIVLQSGTYVNNYGSFTLVPFKVRVNSDTLNGENEIWVNYSSNYRSGSSPFYLQNFSLIVNDTKSDFDVSIKDYIYATQTITFDIINTGKNDVDALTVDLPKQDSFNVKGSTRSIVGSFSKGEDTSFTFEGVPQQGNIDLVIQYSDNIGVRREVNKTVYFDPELFMGRIGQQTAPNYTIYAVVVIIVALIVWWMISRRNKRKKLEKMQMQALKRK